MKNKLMIDEGRREVFYNNKIVPTTKTEYAILRMLYKSNKALSRGDIINHLYGPDDLEGGAYDRVIDQYICRIRAKVKDKIIETVNGFGYRLAR